MSRPIPLDPGPGPAPAAGAPASPRGATQGPDAPKPNRRSWFHKMLGGLGWLAATPADWLDAKTLSRGASLISRLSSAARAGTVRDRRFRVEDRGSFDLRATAFSCGISVTELEVRLTSRQRQTATLAYALFALACVVLVAWIRSALSAPLTGSRLLVAVEFLPFCCLFLLMAFYNALVNFQIRMRRAVGWREYLTTEEPFFPR